MRTRNELWAPSLCVHLPRAVERNAILSGLFVQQLIELLAPVLLAHRAAHPRAAQFQLHHARDTEDVHACPDKHVRFVAYVILTDVALGHVVAERDKSFSLNQAGGC